MQLLFQLELSGAELNEQLTDKFWEGNDEEDEVKEFTYNIVRTTREHLDEIDAAIKKAAEHWSIERMAVIDKNILRAATSEIFYRTDIPNTVVINEAIEVAKKYSTEESASFINGILDKIAQGAATASGKRNKQ